MKPKPAAKSETSVAASAAPPPVEAKPQPATQAAVVVASNNEPAVPETAAAPQTNPFNAGQPETMASSKSCMHLMMAKDGKLRCAVKSASLP